MTKKQKSQLSLFTSSRWGDIPDWTYASLYALMEALRVGDLQTYEHCLRVGEASGRLALSMGLNDYEQRIAHITGMLHDIGKIGISKEILHKPSRLNDLEYNVMKEHPVMSEEIIFPLAQRNSFLQETLGGIRGHHERLDGRGYPDKIAGDKIPLMARIVLVTDTFDAMANNRAYRQGLPVESIYEELKKFSGLQFDGQIVKIFLQSHPHWNSEQIFDLEISEKVSKKAA